MAGVAYKRDINDMRESPALDVMAVLEQKGALVSYTDPYVPSIEAREWPGNRDLVSASFDAETLSAADCVVILTDHRTFDYELLVAKAPLVVDARNTIKTPHPHVFKIGAPVTPA